LIEESPQYLFVGCQRGAEAALKAEVERHQPDLRLAYSRAGFVTFKRAADEPWSEDFDLRAVFARCHGFCLGKLQDASGEKLAESFWQMVAGRPFQRLHVWERDAALPGVRGFEPGVSPLAEEVGRMLQDARPEQDVSPEASQDPQGPRRPIPVNRPAHPGQRVLDCILVEPGQWWVGWHKANSVASCWPGGVCVKPRGQEHVSRAFLKMVEALAWSRLPIAAGQRCAEIGSAPGGSCQALLARGLHVVGIDPAEMDPEVLAHPRFRHLRARAADLKRREFRDIQWLFADSNVAPQHTLDSVEAIVTHRQVHVRGMLLTLKLSDWALAEQIDAYLERIRGWGFRSVRARQLAFNRREICVCALRRPSMRRERILRNQQRSAPSDLGLADASDLGLADAPDLEQTEISDEGRGEDKQTADERA
jgi:23S rRNA (cytidine2498-2'-O)-methyltransferase